MCFEFEKKTLSNFIENHQKLETIRNKIVKLSGSLHNVCLFSLARLNELSCSNCFCCYWRLIHDSFKTFVRQRHIIFAWWTIFSTRLQRLFRMNIPWHTNISDRQSKFLTPSGYSYKDSTIFYKWMRDH